MARLLYIVYGAYRVGLTPTSSAVELEDRYSWGSDENGASFSFQVLITADTPTNYNTAVAAFEVAMRTPDLALTVVMDSDTRHTYDPAANTGLNPRGSVRKIGGKHNTARSGRFAASITLALPMDATGRAGRRSATVQVFKTPAGRRRCVIDAAYTAATLAMGGVAGARANYAAGIATYAAAQITALGGTWELLADSNVATDQNDKVATGSRVYQELKYNQGVGTLDVGSIKNQRLIIKRGDPSINDTVQGIQGSQWDVSRLQLLEATYSAQIDFAVTTGLKDLWEGTILPHIDESVSAVASSAVIRSTPKPEFNPVENTISASVTYLADVGGAFFQMRESMAAQTDEGIVFRPVWNGDPYARVKYQGPKHSTRTLTRQYVSRSGGGGKKASAGKGGGGALGIFGIGAGLDVGLGGSLGAFGIGSSLGFSFASGAIGGGVRGVVGGGGGSGTVDEAPDQGKEWTLIKTRERESPFSIGAADSPFAMEGWVRSWVWVRAHDVSNRPMTGSEPQGEISSAAGGIRGES